MFSGQKRKPVAAPVEKVFSFLADPNQLPKWMRGLGWAPADLSLTAPNNEVGQGYTCEMQATKRRFGTEVWWYAFTEVADFTLNERIAFGSSVESGSPGGLGQPGASSVRADFYSFALVPSRDQTHVTMRYKSKGATLVTRLVETLLWPFLLAVCPLGHELEASSH